MIHTDWHKCHGQGWSGIITPESFCHPAKFSRALIRRIYSHAIEQGYIVPGSVCIDPFGGVALGALHAMQNGLRWVGCELEEKFANLGRENIALWNRRYAELLPRWGSATLLRGDSRELAAVLGKARCVVSSPPYAETHIRNDACFDEDNLSRAKETGETATRANWGANRIAPGQEGYGSAGGQLGAMIVGSPPYAESLASDDPDKRGGLFRDPKRREDKTLTAEYGDSPGQLGAMKAGAVVGSPPFESSLESKDEKFQAQARPGRTIQNADYGASVGQLGQERGDTFWQAAKTIMQQCYQILTPGGVAIWVLKAFVRNKAIVDFPDQWRQLGESCGFESVELIRAWLVEDRGAQFDLFGGLEERKVERKSFFRRLYEKKYPGNSIDFEVVLAQRKAVHNLNPPPNPPAPPPPFA